MSTASQDWNRLHSRQALLWADETMGQGLANRTIAWGLADRSFEGSAVEAAWAEARGSGQPEVDRSEPRQRWSPAPAAFEPHSWDDEASFQRWRTGWVGEAGADLVLAAGPVGSGRIGWALRASALVADEAAVGRLVRRFWALVDRAPAEPWGGVEAEALRLADPEARSLEERAAEVRRAELKDPPPQASLMGADRRTDEAPLVELVRQVGLPWSADQLAAAAAAWLYRYSGQREVVISSDRAAADGPLGHRSETEYLRLSVEETDTLTSLTARVAAARQADRLRGPGSVGGLGLSSLHLAPETQVPHGVVRPVTWGPSGLPVRADRFDALALRWTADQGGLTLNWGLHAGTYPEKLRKALVDGFGRLASALAAEPDRPIDLLELLDDDEKAALRRQGTGAEPPLAVDLVDAFVAQTQKTPDAVAVEFGGVSLTYREFGRLTDALARKLKALGVGPETTVAVAMPRGFGEIGAMMATLKAGGAYVPIDPSHPVDRVKVVLEDAAPQVLVAPPDSPLRGAMPASTKGLELTDLRALPTSDEPAVRSATPDDAVAYILFTSGSTGRPKGVEVPRSALANFLQSMAREPGLVPTDRVLAITTTTFDISGLELWLPLTLGATVVIADRDTAGDPALLKDFADRHRITLMQATPATWRMLLEAGWKGIPGLKMLCGGEAMNLSLARRLHDCGAELWNVYGPTETTIWSTLDLVPRGTDRITVGHALDHTQITLRDQAGRLVPWGTIGEICLGGRGLARGYKGRPDLTAEKFPSDPDTGERYYKTGDLGRLLADGRLECLGRVDHQIKVRGFRIEPADIETQLRAVAGVREVLVVAHKPADGETLLVLYWVGTASREELHAQAKARLPYYMVPSAYLNVPEFPLSTAGKIDRKKLPVPEAVAEEKAAGRAPGNDREAMMAAVWQEVLGLGFVPVDQDFFALGGTSIRAISLRTKVREAFGIELPLKALFESPTVEGLLARLEGPADPDAPIIWRARKGTQTPWIGLLGVSLFSDIAARMPEGSGFTAVHVPARYIPGAEPFPKVEDLARRYLKVVREVQPQGPYRLTGLCHGGVVAFEVAWLLENEGETVEVVAVLDAELPSSITKIRWRQALEFVRNPAHFLRPAPVRSREDQADNDGRIDVPLVGSETDDDLRRYEQLPRKIRARLVNIQATGGDRPAWYRLRPDLGWRGKAGELRNYAVEGTHLGIMREPHATEIAEILKSAERPVED